MRRAPSPTVAVALGAVVIAALAMTRRGKDETARRARSSSTVTIRADARRLHELWRQPEHLAAFFHGVPMEIVADEPGERFEWRTQRRRPFTGGGSLTFLPAPAARGTQARLALHFEGPGARAIAAFSRVFGASPAQIARETLRRFKALAETGEVPVGAPS